MRPSSASLRRGLVAALHVSIVAAVACHRAAAPVASPNAAASVVRSAPEFAETMAALSEPGGYFDSDNLVTNETSYLHVIGTLRKRGVQGGAYIGVGPDQNFSYIAAIRPNVAFMLDIRRDNMLEHLLFKAAFARARTRAEFLALLTGRPLPNDVEAWRTKALDTLVAHFDSATVTPASDAFARAAIDAGIRATGVKLDSTDWSTIHRFHSAFITEGLGIRYESRGRPGRGFFPSLHDLLLARDVDGSEACYLSRESDFQFVKDLEMRDKIIPVTGNLAGAKAFPALSDWLKAHGETVSALYVSNAEDYVMRDGIFASYAQTVSSLPRTPKSVIIRSYFGSFRGPHPYNVPGFRSTQLLQPIDAFAGTVSRGGYLDYYALVTDQAIDPRAR